MLRRAIGIACGMTIAVGACGATLAPFLGWTCPMRAAGLACPGCGCTTAFRTILSRGLPAALAAEPTAIALLIALVLGVLASFFPRRQSLARVVVPGVGLLLMVTAAANVAFQVQVA